MRIAASATRDWGTSPALVALMSLADREYGGR